MLDMCEVYTMQCYASADAALYMPWPCVRLYLSMSVTSQNSIKMAERIQLVFGMGAFFHLS